MPKKVKGQAAAEASEQRTARILSCLKTVYYFAAKYAPRFHHGLTDYDDLVEIGMIELIKAADRFDPDKGVLFSTFVFLRLRNAMVDAFRKAGKSIRALSLNECEEEIELLSCIQDPNAVDPSLSADQAERLDGLRQRVKKLKPAERQVIQYLYGFGMTQAQAADEMKLTESRISQIHAEAIYKLKQGYEQDQEKNSKIKT